MDEETEYNHIKLVQGPFHMKILNNFFSLSVLPGREWGEQRQRTKPDTILEYKLYLILLELSCQKVYYQFGNAHRASGLI